MDKQGIATQRLQNQHLWGAPLETPESVVKLLGAMQAQEFAYAKWSVAQRAKGANAAAIDKALAGGAILRTHVIRPTWHFVSREDIRWILEVSAPRVHALNAYYYRQTGVDAAVAARANTVFAKSLERGQQLTRKEMAAALEQAGLSASGVRLAYLLMYAELEGVIVSGVTRGKQQTYALLEERAPGAKKLGREGALAELTRRYFASRGPATIKDYQVWAGFTAAEVKRGLEMVKGELDHQVIDGRTYWFAARSAGLRPRSPAIDLVQGYDEYVMSYSESRDVLFSPDLASTRPLDRTSYYHAILRDGLLIGHWRHEVEKQRVVIETQLDRALGVKEMRALNSAVERYGAFLGMPAKLEGLGA